jgi:hypothetical protein
MKTPIDQGAVLQPPAAEPPVWQPLPPAEPIATDDVLVPAAPAIPRPHYDRPTRRSSSVTALLLISAMITLGGVAFAVGRATSTGQSGTGQTTNNAANGLGGQNGAGFGPNASGLPNFDLGGRDGGFGGAATITGTVVSVTSTSITVQLADGQTVTVATGSSTTYHAKTAATSSDVTSGAAVTITTTNGTASNTGSASASASPGTTTTRTATDITITTK